VKEKFLKILTWLGIMAALTLLAIGIWAIGGNAQSTTSLKCLQFLQTIGTFLLPPVLCAWIWDADHKPLRWLHLDQGANWQTFLLAIAIMICAIPGINLLADLNSRVVLPESLAHLEQLFKQQEEAAAELTKRFLEADNIGMLLINIGLMALLPALAEELSFRGTLQQVLKGEGLRVTGYGTHVAIWITAFIFSAIHMQFYGFIPRMLMGAMFGYIFVWTGSLWVPVVMHFTNNGIAVLAYYFLGENSSADTLGAGTTWWLGCISLIVVGVLLWITSRGQQARDRRTHIQ